MNRIIRVACAAAVTLISVSGTALATPVCGQTYTVQPGDSLSLISYQMDGAAANWRAIYEFGTNRDVIGENPSSLLIGQLLQMPPCGQTNTRTISASLEQRVSLTAAPTPRRPSRALPIDIVTGSAYEPFTDEDWHQGGMTTEIVKAAFAASDLPNEVEITFINDWYSHLNRLLPANKYAMTFPWVQPNCNDVSLLPDDMKIRCNYEFSDPLYVDAIRIYAANSANRNVTNFRDLAGSKICRPKGWFTHHLAERGLRDGETMTLVRPASIKNCFELLERGEVDFVSAEHFSSETAIAELGLVGLVSDVRGLVHPAPLHLLAHRDNPEAAYVWLEQFNVGLDRIKQSGEWQRIVDDHIARFRDIRAQ